MKPEIINNIKCLNRIKQNKRLNKWFNDMYEFKEIDYQYNNENNDECIICYDKANIQLPCKHNYCEECLKRINKCCYCMKEFQKYEPIKRIKNLLN